MRQIYSQVGLVVMLAVCGAALRWGGRPERRAAVLIGVAWIALLAAQRVLGQVAPVATLLAMDAAVFVLLLLINWTDREEWLVYGLACQGVALGVHVIRLLSPAMSKWTYLTALAVSSYGLLLCLAWGTWNARRSRRLGLSS